MKPAPLEYFAPASLAEALDLLGRHGDDAKVLAGGQSLLPVLNMRLATPGVLIDLNRIPGLAGVENSAGRLRIGALTRHRQVEWSSEVASACSLLSRAMPHVAHPQIRNRGTIGGNLAHADPASEIPAVVLALGGRIVAASKSGERTIPADEFFLGPLTTALAEDEILTAIEIPAQPAATGTAFLEFARRRGDYALAAVGVGVRLDAAGAITRAAIGLAGATPTPLKAIAAEESLAGRPATEEDFREAASLAAAATDPESDVQAPAAYRRHLIEVLVRRALAAAVADARAEQQVAP